MAVARYGTTEGGSGTTVDGSTGAGRIMVYCTFTASGSDGISAVSWNSEAFTKITAATVQSGGARFINIWYLLPTGTGSHTTSVTGENYGWWTVFTGTDGNAPSNSATTSGNTSGAVSLSLTASNGDWLVGFVISNAGSVSAGSNTTMIGGPYSYACGSSEGVASPTALNYSLASAGSYAINGCVIKPATSTNYPITASQGSFTLTGQIALLKVGWKMLGAYGSFVLSGQTSILRYGRKIVADVGSFVLTGFTTGLMVGKGIVASLGSFVLSGQDTVVKSARTMASTVGSFVLSGQNSVLSYGRIIVASVGNFALTGYSAILRYGYGITASVGSFVLTGQDVSLKLIGTLRTVVGTFVLTGYDVVLTAYRRFSKEELSATTHSKETLSASIFTKEPLDHP